MKLYIPGIREAICFDVQSVHSIVIENQLFMYNTLKDLQAQQNREEGEAVLSIKDSPVEMAKHMEMLTEYIHFDLNQKTLLNRIIGALDSVAQDASHFNQTQMMLSQIENVLNDLTTEFSCELCFEQICASQIIKAVGIKIADSFESLADKVYAYMETVTEFFGEKLFVFVNLRSFLEDSQMQAFIDTAAGHCYKVLFIDSSDRARLKNEFRITIDKDLCEF